MSQAASQLLPRSDDLAESVVICFSASYQSGVLWNMELCYPFFRFDNSEYNIIDLCVGWGLVQNPCSFFRK